ncbi:ABC transporter ATP-binding protein [Streptomyces orinoci]|uniref:ABC transporter ATP-binding protein n=1 Tax=Streptomyces orinoci TaxID=67339 RepID=A0ABV3K5D5_STRON|nr:ABC transporter ATP-binding protein [Streptomyces orinoci]
MTQTARRSRTPLRTGSAVNFTNVTKSYGDVHAVAGLDLAIDRGETVALLGPNGAGKSTTINMLLGLLANDGGRIELLGREPQEAVRAGQVGAMLQEGGLIPRVTIKELIEFMRGTYANPMPLAEILEIAQLTKLADRKADKLSGGQAQRVRFALALCGNPELIVLDEPTAALDIQSRRDLWQTMAAYAARGNTLLFSTHYLEEADEYAERIVVIAQGKVLADGTGAELKKSVGGKTVSIDLGDWDPDGFSRMPGVSQVEVRGARLHLNTVDADATVTALAQSGALRNIEVTGGGLEEAFISLTSGNNARSGS